MSKFKNAYSFVLKSIKKDVSLRPKVNDLTNKTYVVSGGTRGIGLAIAKSLSSMGANITLLGKTSVPHAKLEGDPQRWAFDLVESTGFQFWCTVTPNQASLQ